MSTSSKPTMPRAVCPYCNIETEFEVYTDEDPGTLYTCTVCRVCHLDEAFAAIQNGTFQKPQPLPQPPEGDLYVAEHDPNAYVRRQSHKRQDTPKAKAPEQLTLDLDQ